MDLLEGIELMLVLASISATPACFIITFDIFSNASRVRRVAASIFFSIGFAWLFFMGGLALYSRDGLGPGSTEPSYGALAIQRSASGFLIAIVPLLVLGPLGFMAVRRRK
jgi:hypothetical protein